MYLKAEDFKQLSVELTTKCNAACPMCSRFRRNWDFDGFDTRRPSELMPLSDLPFELFAQRFTPRIIDQLDHILFNGKLGDPIAHPQSLDFFHHIRKSSSRPHINIFTNGSLGGELFWRELAQLLLPTDRVTFSIDGLQDTNSIYRQKTSWHKIMRSASAFINAGGSAYWDFIVFKHNEHQVEEARAHAHNMGFHGFEIRRTNRFKGREHFEYISVGSEDLRLSVPNDKKYVYEYHSQYLDRRPDKLAIDCSFKKEGKLFLSFAGKIWPCSYISEYFPENESVRSIQKIHGEQFNDLRYHAIDEILASPYFAQALENSWSTGVCLSKECWKKCSQNHFNITSVEEED